MKVNELVAKLLCCPQDYDIVLANVEKLDAGGENEYQIRLDHPINQIYKDENEKEILLFTTESRIEINHEGVTEVQENAHMSSGHRQSFGGSPMSHVPISNTPIYQAVSDQANVLYGGYPSDDANALQQMASGRAVEMEPATDS